MNKRIVIFLLISLGMTFCNACTKVSVDYKNLMMYLWLTGRGGNISVTGVTLNKNSTTMLVAGTEQLTATVQPLTASNQVTTWTTSDAAVVTVSANGLLTGVAAGSATVTATTADRGLTATCAVTVSAVPVASAGIMLNKKITTMLVAGTEQLTATVLPLSSTSQNVTWAPSDPAIVTVGTGGLVRASALGTTTVTATTSDGRYSAICSVTVATPPVAVTGVTLNRPALALGIGAIEQLVAIITPANATNQNLTWTSSNPAVAAVGQGGLVTAAAAGSAIVSVRTADGSFMATCAVTVTAPAVAQWARSLISPAEMTSFMGVSAATDGSIYAAGMLFASVAGTYNYGGATVQITWPGMNCVLVKYDSSGTALWVRSTVNAFDSTYFTGVAAALDGSVYAIGELDTGTSYDFGNGVSFTSPNGGAFLVKYDSTGAAQWARYVTSALNSRFTGISIDANGSIYVCGYVDGPDTYDFGNGVTAAVTYAGDVAILVKYSVDGAAQWVGAASGSDRSQFNSVAVAPDGSVCTAGNIRGNGTFDFGGATTAGTCSLAGGQNIVLVKYSGSGSAQWARSVTAGNNNTSFMGVSVAPDGSVYASGAIDGPETYGFGNGVSATATSTSNNAALVKYDSAGTPQWAAAAVATSMSIFTQVSAVSDGTVYALGAMNGPGGTFDFGNSVTATCAYPGGANFLLIKYTGSGAALWADTAVAASNSIFPMSMSIAPDGSIYSGGTINSTSIYDFGNGATIAGPSTQNCMVVKYK